MLEKSRECIHLPPKLPDSDDEGISLAVRGHTLHVELDVIKVAINVHGWYRLCRTLFHTMNVYRAANYQLELRIWKIVRLIRKCEGIN